MCNQGARGLAVHDLKESGPSPGGCSMGACVSDYCVGRKFHCNFS